MEQDSHLLPADFGHLLLLECATPVLWLGPLQFAPVW